MNLTFSDLNNLITQAKREIAYRQLPFKIENIYILLGQEEYTQAGYFMYYSPDSFNKTAIDLLKECGINVILTMDKSRFEYCFKI